MILLRNLSLSDLPSLSYPAAKASFAVQMAELVSGLSAAPKPDWVVHGVKMEN